MLLQSNLLSRSVVGPLYWVNTGTMTWDFSSKVVNTDRDTPLGLNPSWSSGHNGRAHELLVISHQESFP